MTDEEHSPAPPEMPETPGPLPRDEESFAEVPAEPPAEAPAQAFDTPPEHGNPAPNQTPVETPNASRALVPGPVASDDDRLMGALAWVSMVILQLPLVSLILLISDESKHRPFQRYHGVASIIFWVAAFVYEMVAAVAYVILGLVTFTIGFLCLWPIFFIPHVVALWYAWQAYQGRYSEVPIISSIARDQRWV